MAHPGPDAAPSPDRRDEEPERVLAEGRLHPATLLLRLASLLGRSGVPAAIVVVQVLREGPGALVLWGTLFALLIGGGALVALVDYLHYRYRLTTRELQITRGAISRHERRIPVDRIQDLSSEQSLLHRMLGVVKVGVETASGGREAEADIDALAPSDAELLRAGLQRVGTAGRSRTSGADEGAREPSPLLRVGHGELLLRGLTDNRAGLLLAGAAYLLDVALDLTRADPAEWLQGVLAQLVGTAASRGLLLLALTAALGIVGVLVVGWVLSAAATWVRFYGFALAEQDDVFQRRFGLLTRRTHALPRRRIQALRIEQTWLRLLVGVAVMRTDNAGSAAEGGQEASARSVFVPAGRPARLEALVPTVLPGADLRAVEWRRTSPRIVRRFAVRGLVWGALLGGIGYRWLGPATSGALLLAIPFAIAGALALRRLGYALEPDYLLVRWGIGGLYRAVVPLGAVQSIELRRSPLERLHGLAHLVLHVAGGAHVVVPNLPAAEARDLHARLATEAVEHPFTL